MDKYFIKTHYEHAIEHLETVAPTLMVQNMLDLGMDPTYEQFCRAASNTMAKIGTPEMIAHFFNVYFHMYQMKNCAEQIYYITPDLSAKLAQTKCNTNTYFLRSPYREIYIQINQGLFYINDLEGGKSSVDGFYVYLRELNGFIHIRVMACSLLKSTPEIPFNDATFYFHIEMKPGKIQEQLKIFLDKESLRKKEELDQYDKYRNVDHLEEFAKFVFNTLLYITSKRPDLKDQEPFDFDKKLEGLKSKSKKKKLIQRIEKATTRRIIVVGSNIKDRNNEMGRIKRAGGIGKWKLDHKILVENHWRTQWYGSKKDGTRYSDNIWIENYEKGPEFTELLTSKHVIK